jgi:type VI secretion system protein ImpJ
MFLTPQHFQSADRYHEQYVHERLHALSPFGWGIMALEADEDALRNGEYRLLRLRAVMPDGVVVSAPDSDPLPPSRRLADVVPSTQDKIEILLAIPTVALNGVVCSLQKDAAGTPARYTAVPAKFVDETTGDVGAAREILVHQPTVRILVSGEETSGYGTIKLHELVRAGDGFILQETFIPPALYLEASPTLRRLVSGLIEVLIAKRTTLAAHVRHQVEAGLAANTKTGALQALSGMLPALMHVVSVGRHHPEALYLMLARFFGELTAYHLTIDPRTLSPYRHTDLRSTFAPLIQQLRTMIDELAMTRYVAVPLEPLRESVLLGRIQNEELLRKGEFYLEVRGSASEDKLQELSGRLKVAAPEELDTIIAAALPGVRLSRTTRPPASLPLKPDAQYFQLDTHGDFWESVCLSRQAAFYIAPDLKGLQFELLVTG